VTRATASHNKWQRRSREAWREVLTRFAASGLEVEAFCAQETSAYRASGGGGACWRMKRPAQQICPRQASRAALSMRACSAAKAASSCGSISEGA